MRILALALLFVASPAFAADQFDLICTAKGDTAHFRIDLASGEWCAMSCVNRFKLVEVTSGSLVLKRSPGERPTDPDNDLTINRVTGEWSSYEYNRRLDTIPETDGGTCKVAPFSGMPGGKF